MGRVSRYKRTKSCDPFYKGKKHHIDKHATTKNKKSWNDTNVMDEQKMPRTMKTLLERAQQLNSKKRKKLKRLDTNQDKVVTFQKRKNENTREYFQRIDQEAAHAVVESLKGDQKMSDRRKNHLKKRKEKQKAKKNPERVLQTTTLDFTDLKDDVRFGDVASQPPLLTAKPRKAPEKKTKSLLLAEHKDTPSKQSKEDLKVKPKRRKHMTEIEKAVMDKERLRVIEAYRKGKKKSSMDT